MGWEEPPSYEGGFPETVSRCVGQSEQGCSDIDQNRLYTPSEGGIKNEITKINSIRGSSCHGGCRIRDFRYLG